MGTNKIIQADNIDGIIAPRNYISNPFAYKNVNGAVTYADAAGVVPVDGSGGSPTITLTRNTTAPLANLSDFLITKPASNVQGQGVSTDFTIDECDKYSVLQGSFDYKATGYTDDLLEVFVFDVTNSVLIYCTPSKIKNSVIPNKMQFEFQTTSSASYRLILHFAGTSASAMTMQFSSVMVGRQAKLYGSPITDWQSYTPTFSALGTVSAIDFQWRRVGDSIEVSGRYTCGTPIASEPRITLPNGLTVSSTKVSSNRIVGYYNGISTTGGSWSGYVIAQANQNYINLGYNQSGNDGLTIITSANAYFGAGEIHSLSFTVPITGFGSQAMMSSDASTRIVAAHIANANSVAANTIIPYSTVAFDTHGGFSGSRYTVRVPGYYQATCFGASAPANQRYDLWINGVNEQPFGLAQQFGALGATILVKRFLNVGDILDVRADGTTGSNALNSFSVTRISGPSQIAASEKVFASYWMGANKTPGTAQWDFDSKEIDSHNAIATGAGVWKFTSPYTSTYRVSVYVGIQNITGGGFVGVYKNGVAFKTVLNQNTTWASQSFSFEIRLLAGEFIDIRCFTNYGLVTLGGSLATAGTSNITISSI